MTEGPVNRVWILGFAGHRGVPDKAAAKAAILACLKEFKASAEGEWVGRSSAAAGADLLFLEACQELGMAYSIILPFPAERFREDFDEPAEWEKASRLIAAAASVEIAPGNEIAPEAYHLAAREILDVSDAMLLLWDQKPARGIGGTAESVTEARERNLPVRIIDAGTLAIASLERADAISPKDEVFGRLPSFASVPLLFEELDRRALHGAPRSRWFAAGSISLNQIATVISGVLIAFKLGENAAPVVKFLIVTAAACLPWVGARFRINDSWIEDRLHAELLRSLLASHSFAAPLRPFAAELFDDDAPFLRSAAWRLIPLRREWHEERTGYLADRLDGQIRYLESKGELAARRLKTFWTMFRIASSGAMALGALAIFAGVSGWQVKEGSNRLWLMFLPTILPAVAAWCLAMIPLFEYKRRAKVYRHMAGQLAKKRTELLEAKCRTTAAAVVASCERLLLTELWEWAGTRGKRKR